MPPPTPVTLVTGLTGSGKSTLLRAIAAARPPTQRWALVGQGGDPRVDASLGPGCACCAAPAVLRTVLIRLLRAGPWDRVLLEADGASHPDTLIDALRDPLLARHLRIDRVVLAVDGTRPQPWDRLEPEDGAAGDAQDPLVGGMHLSDTRRRQRCEASLATADEVVVLRPGRDAEQLAARLGAAGPFGRLVRIGAVDAPAAYGGTATHGSPGACWGPVAFETPTVTAARRVGACWEIAWGPEHRFDRARLAAALSAWSAEHPQARLHGVFATERAWYECRTTAAGLQEPRVSAYRAHSRCLVSDNSGERSGERSVEALTRALGPALLPPP